MDNKEVAAILDEIGTLLELSGDNPFKCRAYHNVSRVVAALRTDLRELVDAGTLTEVEGIGKGTAEKIVELITTGRSSYYEELKKSLPAGLGQMLRIQGLGPKKIKLLYDTLKIGTIDELRAAAEGHRLASIPGFGAKTEANILKGIDQLQKHADKHLYDEAKEAADRVFSTINGQKACLRCEIAGSLRRRREVIGDIDIIVSARRKDAPLFMEALKSHPDVTEVIAAGETKTSVRLRSGIACDLRVVDDEEYPFALMYFTGSKEHNVAMRTLAKRFGWSLNEYGFSELGSDGTRGKAKRIVKCRTEEHIYNAVGLQYIPPELREHLGEIEAAANRALPDLVEYKDIRGTFHCHTTYSDGNNSILEMAGGAKALGWSYIGIADHSKVAAYAGGLTAARVKLQHKEIDTLNGTLGDFRIFKGTEVDILGDGTLDWSDRVLAGFDFVVASIHSRFKMTEAEATKRVISAIKNKYVTMLGHSTGRLLLAREGYPLNLKEVIKAAADYGTVIEINSHPSRLDLDWRWCRFARDNGVRLAINPDAHTVSGLNDVEYGVGIARKGWLTRADIINTLDAGAVSRFLQQKRQ